MSLWEGEFQILQTAGRFGPDLEGASSGHHKTAVSRLAPKFIFVFLGQHNTTITIIQPLLSAVF